MLCCYLQWFAAIVHGYAAIIFIMRCSIITCTVLSLNVMLCCNTALLCCSDLYFVMFHFHMHVLVLFAMVCCNNTLLCFNDLYFKMFHCHMCCSFVLLQYFSAMLLFSLPFILQRYICMLQCSVCCNVLLPCSNILHVTGAIV